MPARRRTPDPPPVDIEAVRRKLAEGRIVRVGISRSAQFPDGGTGRVRSVGDPETDGDEYVQVELSLNGTRDILPFTPADLTPATRGRPPGSGRKPAAVKGEVAAAAAPVPSSTAPPLPPEHGTPAPPLPGTPQRPSPAQAPGDGAETQGAERGTPRAVPASPRAERPASPRAERPEGERAARRIGSGQPKTRPARGAKRAVPVSITVNTTATEPTRWRIEARIGTRVAVKSAAVSPARVWQLVQTLDNEDLNRAVGAILEEHRWAAQARADALASELAAVQAELQALPPPGE